MSSNLQVHPLAIVDSAALIGVNVKIGPFCVVGADVTLGNSIELISHVVIQGNTTIGDDTIIYPFASIGQPPQILKYEGEKSKVVIGTNNIIREYVTIQAGSKDGGMLTALGNDCLLMVGAHIGHDCRIGNNIIIANYASIGGHVEIGDYAVIGGLAGIHQRVRIGSHAMVGGMSGIERDLIPLGLAANSRATLEGINLVGMNRRGFNKQESLNAAKAVNEIFSSEGILAERIKQVAEKYSDNAIVSQIIDFLRQDSSRAFCGPKK